MANIVKEDIQVTVARVLEDWAMMLVDRAESLEQSFDSETAFFVSSIEFHGIVNGRYNAICQEGFAKVLAANLLGLEEDSNDSDLIDALKELINVLSGNLLTASYGEDSVFDLSTPVVSKLEKHDLESLKTQRVFNFLADNEPLIISFSLDNNNAN